MRSRTSSPRTRSRESYRWVGTPRIQSAPVPSSFRASRPEQSCSTATRILGPPEAVRRLGDDRRPHQRTPARVNALVSGAVDAIDSVPYAFCRRCRRTPISKRSISRPATGIRSRCASTSPHSTIRASVRRSMDVDRHQMINDAYGGPRGWGTTCSRSTTRLRALNLSAPAGHRESEVPAQAGRPRGRTHGELGHSADRERRRRVVGRIRAAGQSGGRERQLTKLDTTTFYNDQYFRAFSRSTGGMPSGSSRGRPTPDPDLPFRRDALQRAQFKKWYLQADRQRISPRRRRSPQHAAATLEPRR